MSLSAHVRSLPLNGNTHAHNFHQLVLGIQGAAEFEMQGHCDQVSPQRGCIAPADVIHAYQGEQQNRVLVVDLSLYDPELSARDVLSPYDALFDKPQHFSIDGTLRQLLHFSVQETERFGTDTQLLQQVGGLIVHCLYQRLCQSVRQQPARTQLNMAAIDRFILDNLQRKISVQQLAAKAHLSTSHFHTLFKQTTGLPPHQYLLKMRLEAAHKLLRESTLSLVQIAIQTGFSSQSALSHSLKQHFGVTPSRIRRALQKR